jgi:Polyketide cyclase / dehydrase and lipid transport
VSIRIGVRDEGLKVASGSYSYRIEQPSDAPATAVYDALLDVERWPEWMFGLRRASWERQGKPDTAEGGIRRIEMPGSAIREEITGGERPHLQNYRALSGLPVTDYRGEVRIDDRPNGCLITWQGTFGARNPVVGYVVQNVMRLVIARAASSLAKAPRRL